MLSKIYKSFGKMLHHGVKEYLIDYEHENEFG